MENYFSQVKINTSTGSDDLGGGRICYLDALKCLGILLVIEGHVRGAMGIKVYDTLSGLMFYSFDMPIFFFVSGFLAYKSNMTFKEVVRKMRQKFIYLIIPAIVFKFFNDLAAHGDILNVINEGFKGYWFTITLFECFLIYYLLHIICKKDIWRITVLLTLAFIGVGFLSIFGDVGPQLLDLNHLTKYFQYFVFGIIAMKYTSKFIDIMNLEICKAIVIIVYFLLLFLTDYNFQPIAFHHLLRDLLLRYLGTFIIISFFVCHANMFNKDSKINRAILSVGRYSLPIYLLQYFFIPHFEPIPEWMTTTNMITIHIISCFYTIVIAGVCMLFLKLLSNSSLVRKYCFGQK